MVKLSNEQKQKAADTPESSALPWPAVGTHTFAIIDKEHKHDDYGEFVSLAIICESLTEPETKPMKITWKNTEKSIANMCHFYARHVLGHKYANEDINEDDMIGVEFVGDVQPAKPYVNNNGETMPGFPQINQFTTRIPLSEASPMPPAPADKVAADPVPEKKAPKDTAAANLPAAKVSDKELDDLING